MDWEASSGNLLTLQGDLYENRIPRAGDEGVTKGGNVTGRWSHTLSADSGLTLQMYYDRVHRNLPGSYNDRLDTYDIDFQHNFQWGQKNRIVWGAGYRRVEDDFQPGEAILLPQHLTLETTSAFAQDEIAIIRDELHLTIGTKVEHNDYTGVEWQPSARIAWHLDENQTYWAAVSRAVRTPSRLDRDLFIPGVIGGSPNFDSEELAAWELGCRIQPAAELSFAVATFYHDYDGIRSTELAGPDANLPLALGNGQKGESYGAELTVDYQAMDWWRLHAGITELRVTIEPKPGSADTSFGAREAVDSNHYYSLQSHWNLPGDVEAHAALRYVSRVTNPLVDVPGYTELDTRITWNPSEKWRLSIAGRNLLHDSHVEYGDAALSQEIERSIYAIVQWNP
jgi:iron complex outermembrane receptor protein